MYVFLIYFCARYSVWVLFLMLYLHIFFVLSELNFFYVFYSLQHLPVYMLP